MKLKSTVMVLGLTGLGLLVSSGDAQAALTWNWSYTAGGVVASGQWVSDGTTYDSTGATTYNIQSITGARDGILITGLDSIYDFPDNQFKWDGSNILADNSGFSYSLAAVNPRKVSVYNFANPNGPRAFGLLSEEGSGPGPNVDSGFAVLFPISSKLAPAVPEPSEILGTLFFGAIGAGYLLQRRSHKVA